MIRVGEGWTNRFVNSDPTYIPHPRANLARHPEKYIRLIDGMAPKTVHYIVVLARRLFPIAARLVPRG